MFRASRKKRKSETAVEYWISYSDLMAGLLLVFILLLVGTLTVSKVELERREAELVAAEEELEKLKHDVDSILGVRARLIERLKKRFDQSGSNIYFDDSTGAIRLGSSILFEEGDAELSPQGQKTLEEFIPTYYEALLGDPELRKYVGQIIFEGHTNSNYSGSSDPDEAYLYNLQLSQARAYAAMEFVIDEEVGSGFGAKRLLAANGYSSSRLVYADDDGKVEDKERSRRLEIRFRLRDEEALVELNKIFERLGETPGADTVTP